MRLTYDFWISNSGEIVSKIILLKVRNNLTLLGISIVTMIRLFFYTLLFSSTMLVQSHADVLRGLKEKGWGSYYGGYRGSGYEVGVDTLGKVQFYFTPRKGIRLNRAWPIEARIRIERREKGEKNWVKKNIRGEEFTPMDKVSFGQENIEYIATVTGGAQFKCMLEFDKYGVNITSEMVGKLKDADTADYRLVLETQMPNMLTGSAKYKEKELKKKTRGDEVRLGYKKESEEKIPLYIAQDAEKLSTKNPMSIMLKSDKIGRKKLTWSILDKKDSASFSLDFKSTSRRFLDGFNMRVILINEQGEQLTKGIRMEYR